MKTRKIISLLLAVMMIVAVIPAGIISASAQDANEITWSADGGAIAVNGNSYAVPAIKERDGSPKINQTWNAAGGTTSVKYAVLNAFKVRSDNALDLSDGFKLSFDALLVSTGGGQRYWNYSGYKFLEVTIGEMVSGSYDKVKCIKFEIDAMTDSYILTVNGESTTVEMPSKGSKNTELFTAENAPDYNKSYTIEYKNGYVVVYCNGEEIARCALADASILEKAKVTIRTREESTADMTAYTTEYDGTGRVAVFSNVTLEKIPESVAPTFEGVQEGKVDDVFSVRFVATVKDLNYSEVGFKITAMDGEKSWTNRTHTVYSKLIGNTDTGVVEYTKENLDGEYIYALTIKGVPTTGTVTFNVKTYGIVDGIELEGRTYAVTYTDGEFVSVERVISYEKQTYKMSKIVDKVKVIGRSMMTTDGISCDWGASGIEFNAYCKGDVEVNIINEMGLSGYDADSYFSVFLDGELVAEDVKAAGTSSNVVILKNLEQGLYNIKILKQNEALNNCTAIKSITLEGEISDNKPQDKELYIECLGDSIFSGYGVLRSDRGGHSDDTNGLYAYGYLTAQKFGADCSLMSVSGIAFAKGFRKYTMPQIYKYTSYLRSQTEEYSFERIPDLVLLNLGSNDIFNNAPLEDFKEGVRNLVNQIQERYGKDIKIVVSSGLMGDGNISYIAEVFAEFGGEAAGLYTYSELPNDTSGGGAHPSKAGQAEAAERISRFISSKLGWEIVG